MSEKSTEIVANTVANVILPDKTDHTYNLRSRRHSLSLTVKTDGNNLLNRVLFKDIY